MKGDGRKYNIKPDSTSDKILQLKLFCLKVSRLEERTQGSFWGWKTELFAQLRRETAFFF